MKLSARIWKKVPESGVKSEHGYASFVPNNELEAFRAGFGNFQILPSSCVPTIRQWRQWKTKEGQMTEEKMREYGEFSIRLEIINNAKFYRNFLNFFF